MTTAHIDNVHGYNCLIPNTVIEGDGFYVSYNDYDAGLHGGVTTALVKGQMEHFYILYGDHRAGYAPLISKGFAACFNYFKQHKSDIARYSEQP